MQNINTLRQHMVLAIVTLVIAAILLALTFISLPPVVMEGGPDGGGNQMIGGPTNFNSSAPSARTTDQQLVAPPFTLSAS